MSLTVTSIFLGTLTLGFYGIWLIYSLGTRKARNSPPTPKHAFSRQIPDTVPGESRRPKLSASGRVVVLFACPAGLIGLGVTWATLHRLLEDRRYDQAPTATAVIVNPRRRASDAVQYEFAVAGQVYQGATHDKIRAARTLPVHYLASNPTSNRPVETPIPVSIALLIPLLFDVVFLWLLRKLSRDHALARRGRLTTGIVVGYAGNKAPGAQSLVTIFYDFLNTRENVLRGRSIVANYTPQGPYYLTALGSGVEVFYLPEHPERNALRASLTWEI
jgi:hypothetical protein